MSEVKILIATHKPYEFPNDSGYLPIQVGKEISQVNLGILADNTGDNISEKNASFCELTALYWAWKNLSGVKYVGLVHYRRYFMGQGLQLKDKSIASADFLLSLLADCDVIAPKKRNYYIESVYEHYKHAHNVRDLDLIRTIIVQKTPEYLVAFDDVMNGKTLHLFNMFVMKKEYFDSYCEWVFSILFELDKQIDISMYDTYQKRVFGFLSERLFNVWLLKNNLSVKELHVINLEPENILIKILKFLKRKFIR